jgi:hypothetical protein
MARKLLAAASVALLVFSMGCTGTEKARPGPVDPSGPLLSAGQAISVAEEYLYTQYDRAAAVIPFTLTTKMQGDPCAWNGTDAGNATRWMMIFEALTYQSGVYKHVTLAVTVAYLDGNLGARQTRVQSKAISQEEGDNLYDELDNRSLATGILFDNHAVFINASAAEQGPGASHYLQSISMVLYDRFSSPNMPGRATWEVRWKYINEDTYEPAYGTVVLNATDGSFLKMLPAG